MSLPRLGRELLALVPEDLPDEHWAAAHRAALSSVVRTLLESALDSASVDALAHAHATLLGTRLTRTKTGRLALAGGGHARKSAGAFFTPPAVARALARRTLAAAPPGVVLDPAAGAGALLLAAADVLLEVSADADDATRRPAVAARLVGLDADPDAVLLARALLRVHLGREARVEHADALAPPERLAPQGPDPGTRPHPEGAIAPPPPALEPIAAVLANPPFAASYARGAKRLDPRRAALLARRFPEIGPGERNGFLLFLALALEQLGTEGRLGFVVPDAFLTNERYARSRRTLLERGGVDALVLDWPAFGSAAVRTALVVLDPTRAGLAVGIARNAGELEPFARGELPGERLRTSDLEARAFAFPRGTTDLRLEAKLRAAGAPLGELAWVRDGINPGPRAFRETILSARDLRPRCRSALDRAAPRPPRFLCLEGKDVRPFALAPARLVVRADPALLTPDRRARGASFRESWIFESEKLLSRQTSPVPLFARDTGRHRFLNSAHATGLLPGTECSLLYLLALLNASPVRWFHARTTGETRRLFPQVHVRSLRLLPVPRRTPGDEAHDALEAVARALEADPGDRDAHALLEERAASAFGLRRADAARILLEARALGPSAI